MACELVVWQNRSKAGTRFGFLASCAVSACHLLLRRSSSHARDGGKCSNLRRERGDKPNSGEFPSLGWSEDVPELVHLACFGRAELRLGVGEPEKASKEGTGGSFRGIIDDSWILSRLYVSREATGQPLDVSPHVSVAEACRNFGRFVTFQFVEPGSKEVEGEASEPKNALAELMRSAAAQTRSLVLPVPRNERRGDWRLFNALIHSFKSDGLGFSTASGLAETSGKEFVDALATVLFHLLIPERIERMEARGIKLPARWTKLTDGGVTFNDPKAHKHGVGALTKENVIQWRDMLYRVLLFPWLSKQQWHGISQATRDLASCLHKYATYLESSTQRVNAMHNMLEPARCPGDGSSSELKRIESTVCRANNCLKYLNGQFCFFFSFLFCFPPARIAFPVLGRRETKKKTAAGALCQNVCKITIIHLKDPRR